DLLRLRRQVLGRYGRRFDPEVQKATYELFTELQRRAPRTGITVERDIAYGEHERQRLDVHAPADRPVKAPIVAYFHGGGYVGGQRSPVPDLIYDNVAVFFARNGMIGINATYRLAPQYTWPSGGQDVGLVVEWLRSNARQWGGDPDQIFLIGQSAGG